MRLSLPKTENFSRSDAYASMIIGLVTALIIPVIARSIALEIPLQRLLIFVLPLASLIGLNIVFLLNKFVAFAYQASKFVLVGLLNTAVDFGVANILILATGLAVGWQVSVFKGVSFTVAVINSYFWNKYWTFRKKEGGGMKEFSQFFAVSIIGFGVNVGTATFVINFLAPVGGMSPERWANVGFLAATVLSLAWNFVGYKFWVFAAPLKRKKAKAIPS